MSDVSLLACCTQSDGPVSITIHISIKVFITITLSWQITMPQKLDHNIEIFFRNLAVYCCCCCFLNSASSNSSCCLCFSDDGGFLWSGPAASVWRSHPGGRAGARRCGAGTRGGKLHPHSPAEAEPPCLCPHMPQTHAN